MNRKDALKKLDTALSEGKVDKEIAPLLNKINTTQYNGIKYYTTSSCAGRIHLYEIEGFGNKLTMNHLGKWHSKVGSEDFSKAVKAHKENELWLKVQPPIIHIACPDLDSANSLLKTAYSSGFKYSSIKSTSPFLVEITSSEHMELPLGKDGKLFVGERYLKFLLGLSNEKLKKSQSKIERLIKNL